MSIKEALKNIYAYEYKPEALIADGAEAITNGFMNAFGYDSIHSFIRVMCWAHVHRAIEIRTKSLENPKLIRDDINLLQLSPNKLFFNFAYGLFKKNGQMFIMRIF